MLNDNKTKHLLSETTLLTLCKTGCNFVQRCMCLVEPVTKARVACNIVVIYCVYI